MKKDEYIRLMLLENIDISSKTLKELEVDIKEISELPNDCTGMVINGEVCENKNYKHDMLNQQMHIVGYFEAMKEQSKLLLSITTMDDKEFDDYLADQGNTIPEDIWTK